MKNLWGRIFLLAVFVLSVFSCKVNVDPGVDKPETPTEQYNENSDPVLVRICVNGREVAAGESSATASFDSIQAEIFTITDVEAAAGITIELFPRSAKATAEFGKLSADSPSVPTYYKTGTMQLTASDYIIVRVSAKNDSVTKRNRLYYKFKPIIETDPSDATLAKIFINGRVVQFGSPSADMSMAEAVEFDIVDTEAQAGVLVSVYPTSSIASAAYGIQAGGTGVVTFRTNVPVVLNDGDFLIVRVTSENGERLFYKFAPVIEVTPIIIPPIPVPRLLDKVIILHAYGTGTNTDGGVSHSFIELYNKSDEMVSLSGNTIQYSTGGTSWQVIDLEGKYIPPDHSFLILGKKMNERDNAKGTGQLQLNESTADKIVPGLQMDNKQWKVFLVESTDPVTVKNPFDVDNDKTGKKYPGYVDLLGVNDNDKTRTIDAFETSLLSNSSVKAPYLISKGKSARRVDITDTDDNTHDFEAIEWRSVYKDDPEEVLDTEEFNALRPRCVTDGEWDPVYPRVPIINKNARIAALVIAGQSVSPGTPSSNYSTITGPGSVNISNMLSGAAIIDIALQAPEATFRTAKVSGSGAPSWSGSFSQSYKPSYSFNSGDNLYIEVTAKNGKTVNVYKIVVNVTAASGTVAINGSYALDINSNYQQSKVVVGAYTTQAATTVVSSTQAIIATNGKTGTGTWSMQVPAGQEVWFKIFVTDTTGYTFEKVVSTSGDSYSGDTSGIALSLGPFVEPSLTAFTLINATAGGGKVSDKEGVINQNTGVITMPETEYTRIQPSMILNYHKLAADFTLSAGTKLYSGGVEQVSGVTPNNYYQQVTFTAVAEDNARKTYTVAGPVQATGSTANGRVVGTKSWQTQGFGIMNITTTDTTLGLPTGTSAHKLNVVWNPTGTYTYYGPTGRVISGATAIKGHGNNSIRSDEHKSYALKLDTKAGFDYYEYKTGQYVTLPEHKRWVLLAHNVDNTRIHGALGFEMGRRVLTNMGWQPHADWVYLFLNGSYQGLYILCEERKIDPGRMNIGPEASKENPNGGWIVELNNLWWYASDYMDTNANYLIFDGLYHFMTSHQNPVRYANVNMSSMKYQGVAFTFKVPDTDLGWYYADPPEGNGNLSYSSNTFQPRKGIVLGAKLSSGSAYNRASKSPGDWVVPNDFGQSNGMGTYGMVPTGSLNGGNDGGIYGSRTLKDVYPGWESSFFVKASKFIQDAEDTIYAHNYGTNGVGGYHDYIDIDSFIDWQIAMEMVSHFEAISLNGVYMYYDPSVGKLKMGIVWDLDRSWTTSNANPGFLRKIPFWYKELLGWELTATSFSFSDSQSSLAGGDRSDRKDPYYVQRLKNRWAAVKNQLSTELDPYIDATNARFSRITGYDNPSPPISMSGSRTGLKSTITTMRGRLDTIFSGY